MKLLKLDRLNPNYIHVPLIGVFLSIYFILWHIEVSPVPSIHDHNSFYYPFLNYLIGSMIFEEGYSFLSRLVLTDNSPLGLLIPAEIVAALNIQSLFIDAYYLVSLPLIFILCVGSLFFNFDTKTRWIFVATIFFFPPVQILLKSDFTHSSGVVFSIISVLFMRSYLNNSSLANLIGFSICIWYASITSITGLLLGISILTATYASLKGDHHKLAKFSQSLIIIGLLSAPYYYSENLSFFMDGWVIPAHLPKNLSIILIFSMPVLLLLSNHIYSPRTKLSNSPKFFKNYCILMCCLILTIYQVCKDPQSSTAGWVTLLTYFAGYLSIIAIRFIYNFDRKRHFEMNVSIISLVNSLLLYEFSNQKILALLIFALLLLCIQSFIETRNNRLRLFFLIVCVISSNFFPTSAQLQKWLEGNGMRLSVNLIKNLHFNTLGWQKSEMQITQLELQNILSNYDFSDMSDLCVFDNLHFNSRLLLSFPVSYSSTIVGRKRLDELPLKDLKELLVSYGQIEQKLFEEWIHEKRFAYLIEGLKPWEIDHQPSAPLEELQNNPGRKSEIGMSLSRAFFSYLHNSGKISQYYKKFNIPQTNTRIRLYILKNTPKIRDQSKELNLELSKLGLHLPVDLDENNKPDWFTKIHPNIQNQIRSREALRVYTLGRKFLEQANYLEAYKKFRRAFELNPTNPIIKTEYERIQSRLPNSIKKFLEN